MPMVQITAVTEVWSAGRQIPVLKTEKDMGASSCHALAPTWNSHWRRRDIPCEWAVLGGCSGVLWLARVTRRFL